ncbi:MAG: tryptophan 7-halogenase [Myxococcales bacterium]|nr:tryptophan 7-halogenase [Myxococcales bacterium]MDH5305779.1 tryptophan 7-halogenase [Myxococcales bacterium]MDH5565305.1 tryptophan 7-halogenase [Myxococcales bacterium]
MTPQHGASLEPRARRRIAVLGGGPAGAGAAAFLAGAGLDVCVFARGKRPPIIVGESLVPAVVPYLRRLGIEEEVAAYSVWKGGATFVFDRESRLNIRFDEVRDAKTTYSYNVPRDRFDASILGAAQRCGARVVELTARLERDGDSDRVRLCGDALAAAGWSEQPDLVIDAGGRSRVLTRLLGIPHLEGDRRDTALHAHFEGIEVEVPGNVHTDRLEHGWAWRIPLQGRVSMGLVVDGDILRKFGDSAEEQMDAYLRHDAVIRDFARPARRVTPVVRYTNYQARTTRGVGENWALVGDAFGFVDPVFSSGALVAFQSADLLARAVVSGDPAALARYEKEVMRNLDTWHRVIRWFYDGRLLTLFRVGQYVRETWPGRLVDFHFRKHMPKIFTGEDVTNRYSLALVSFMVKHGLARNDPRALQIL